MAFWLIIGLVVVLMFGLVAFRGAPYVPTHRSQIKRAFRELYVLSKDDVLLDIGSGDGVVLRQASGYGARAIGYELNPLLVVLSRMLSRRDPRVTIRLVDAWLTPLPDDVTIVYAFTVSRDLAKLARKLQSEADRVGRPLALMLYGHRLRDVKPQKLVGAHALYEFRPLH